MVHACAVRSVLTRANGSLPHQLQADAYARNVDRDYRSGAAGGGSFWQRRKKWIIGGLIALLVIIAVAVAVPVA